MQCSHLTSEFAVSVQISPDDVPEIAKLGFKTIINNRPDDEADNQPSSSQLAEVAQKEGIEYHHQPVISGNITDQDIDIFEQLLDSVEGPVLAFCRTGTRCTVLWALSQVGTLNTEEILSRCHQAGYDLSSLRARIETRGGTSD
ncbi:MAG TPA: TIGR01244 family phosphatase [Gammaproteobacteria bacterium]|nr:TIGR01244 family phosphatase [Gammaproteobacteria bacterium]